MSLRGFKEVELLAIKLATPYGASDCFALVTFCDSKSDALCLVDVTGRPIEGDVISARLQSPEEERAWNAFGLPDCAGCGSLDVVASVAPKESYCDRCALALVLLVAEAA